MTSVYIQEKLNYLSINFVEPENRTSFLGYQVNTTNGSDPFSQLFQMPDPMLASFFAASSTPVSDFQNALNNIYIRGISIPVQSGAAPTFTAFAAPAFTQDSQGNYTLTITNATNAPDFYELNLSQLGVAFSGPFAAMVSYLDQLRRAMIFLDDSVYIPFRSALAMGGSQMSKQLASIYLPSYLFTSGTTTFETANLLDTGVQSILSTVLGMSFQNGLPTNTPANDLDRGTSNRVVMRRLLVLQECLVNIQVLNQMYVNWLGQYGTSTDPTTRAVGGQLLALILFALENLKTINDSMLANMDSLTAGTCDSTASANSFGTILCYLNKTIQAYRDNSANMKSVNSFVQGQKRAFQGEMSRTSGRSSIQARQRIFDIIAMVSVMVALLGAIVIVAVPMADRVKQMVAAILFGITVLLIFILTVLQNRYIPAVTEGFASGTGVTDGDFAYLKNQTGATQMNSAVQTAIFSLSDQYLEDTIFLVMALQSFSTYENINAITQTELLRYLEYQSELDTNTTYVDEVNRVMDRKTKVAGARVQMFLSIMFIIAVAMLGVAFLPSYQKEFGIGSLVALFVVVVGYLLYITSLVRTDGQKLYWYKPAVSGLP